jgi:hypothetical protein
MLDQHHFDNLPLQARASETDASNGLKGDETSRFEDAFRCLRRDVASPSGASFTHLAALAKQKSK